MACCSCYASTATDSMVNAADCSKFSVDDLSKSDFIPTVHDAVAMIGWDIMSYQACIGVVLFCPYVLSLEYYFKNFKPTFIKAMLLSLVYVTVFGDCLGRNIMKLPQPLAASGKLFVSIIIIIMTGYDMSKKMVKTDEKTSHKITNTWYVHSLGFGNTAATFFGPFLFNIFIQNVYTDPATSEGMRLVLSTFGIPILFWILSTIGRFSCYSIARYGSEGHSVWKKHFTHKALFVLQLVYVFNLNLS